MEHRGHRFHEGRVRHSIASHRQRLPLISHRLRAGGCRAGCFPRASRLSRTRGESRGRITRVVETHLHADHLSRSRRLAEVSAAELHLPEQNRVSFPFIAIRDGDFIPVGATGLKALRTPGHTLESTSYLLEGQGGAGRSSSRRTASLHGRHVVSKRGGTAGPRRRSKRSPQTRNHAL